MMSRLGIRPNEWTWLIFLDCHVSGKAKASLLSHITQKGYLTRESARSMLHLTIQGAFSSHLASGKDVDSFFNKMTDEYGAEWVGLAIINQMVSVTSRRGDRSAMDRLLTICTEERLPVGGSTIIQMVPLLRKNPRLLMVYTLKVMENPGVRLDGHAFEQLFKVAYKSQSYNICRVLWQYACFYKKVTSKMKAIVLDSLSCHKEPSWGNPISKRFELHAGKVIVGAAPDTGPKKSHTASFLRSDLADELPAEFRHKPLLYLVEAVKHRGFDPELQRSVARALVNHDVESGGDYNPVMSMPLMFEAAFEIDQDWGRSPRPLHWLLQNVLAIPAEQKQRGLPESVLSEGIS